MVDQIIMQLAIVHVVTISLSWSVFWDFASIGSTFCPAFEMFPPPISSKTAQKMFQTWMPEKNCKSLILNIVERASKNNIKFEERIPY